ncbi:MAG: protein phosphatase CheZ [Xanthobacteraceae bacterium]|jgi:chemotaxis protein CheZ|nr:protein phosphatase CheZ [Xanthobacteraceae bacterium]
MPVTDSSHFDRLIEFLRQKRDNVTFHDIITLAEVAAQSLQTFFQAMDAKVYGELREIAGYIESMRQEIGVLQVNDLKNSRIPSAGEELDAIVKSTEKATNTIMECAETLMAADASDPAAFKALVDEKMLVIFEACSFQDITGQRIAKVVETLQHIETRVARFADVMRAKDLDGYLNDAERARAERKQKLMIHGPQLDGRGNVQNQIDELFA